MTLKDTIEPLKLPTKHAFLHHDSMEGVKNFHATKLYEAVKSFIGTAAEPTKLASSSSSSSSSKGRRGTKKKKDVRATAKAVEVAKLEAVADATPCFIECNTPQQTNGYDCGLYVMAIDKVICQ